MADKTKNIHEGIIAEFRKKAEELGMRIDLKNIDARINGNTSHTSAFPEIFGFKYKSDKDLNDIMSLLIALWNSYPREEFGGKTPNQVFNKNGKEANIKKLLASELMSRINPNDFSSEKEFKKAVDDFQKKWMESPLKDFGGKTPIEVLFEERQKTGSSAKDLHLSINRKKVKMNNETIDSFFSENPEKKKLKTIENREYEYAEILGPLEFAIALYYLRHPDINDGDAVQALENFLNNYNADFEDESFEGRLQFGAIYGLKSYVKTRKISKYEFTLIIKHIMWAISNRDWVPDERAYLNWIINFFGLFNKKEKEEFDLFYKHVGRIYGLSNSDVSNLIITGENRGNIKRGKVQMLQIGKPRKFAPKAPSFAHEEKPGRNDPCPCGSGKKYKKCCWLKEMNDSKEEDTKESFWSNNDFAETMTGKEAENKMKTFHKGHDEDMNFNCEKCNKKISAHNKDWHGGMCDSCFNEAISAKNED